jgi:4a-hydroxytetrahydrobiopterin dehydratase
MEEIDNLRLVLIIRTTCTTDVFKMNKTKKMLPKYKNNLLKNLTITNNSNHFLTLIIRKNTSTTTSSTPIIKSTLTDIIRTQLGGSWTLIPHDTQPHTAQAIKRIFLFKTFPDAFGFMTRLAFTCEHFNHHPEWTNIYNTVNVTLNTHDAGNTVTQKDIELAKVFNAVFDDLHHRRKQNV